MPRVSATPRRRPPDGLVDWLPASVALRYALLWKSFVVLLPASPDHLQVRRINGHQITRFHAEGLEQAPEGPLQSLLASFVFVNSHSKSVCCFIPIDLASFLPSPDLEETLLIFA